MKNCLHQFFSVSFLRCLIFNPANGSFPPPWLLSLWKKVWTVRKWTLLELVNISFHWHHAYKADLLEHWKGGYKQKATAKKQDGKADARREKSICLEICQKRGGYLCSSLLRNLLHVLLSSDLSLNTTKFSLVSFNFLGIQKSVEHCCKSGAAVQLMQLSLGAWVKSSWPSSL